ncbi:MAG: transporter [Calditrichaeota bacterium]|nr:transporter [Calditrichota bacterium]
MLKRLLVIFAVSAMLFGQLANAQVIWRSAKTIKKGSVIAFGEWYLSDLTKSYDWANEEWKDFPDGKTKTVWGLETMVGYGISDRWEAMVHVPVAFKSYEFNDDEKSSSGIGDIYFKTRYAVLPFNKVSKQALTLHGALRLGTGDEEAEMALGDGTTDFAFGGIFTKVLSPKFVGHAKLNYWMNGKMENDFNVGNELKLVGALGYKLTPKVMPRAVFIYYSMGQRENADGDAIDNSEKSRVNLVLDAVIRPKAGLTVRPRVLIPLGGEGAENVSFKPIIDLWYVFNI